MASCADALHHLPDCSDVIRSVDDNGYGPSLVDLDQRFRRSQVRLHPLIGVVDVARQSRPFRRRHFTYAPALVQSVLPSPPFIRSWTKRRKNRRCSVCPAIVVPPDTVGVDASIDARSSKVSCNHASSSQWEKRSGVPGGSKVSVSSRTDCSCSCEDHIPDNDIILIMSIVAIPIGVGTHVHRPGHRVRENT